MSRNVPAVGIETKADPSTNRTHSGRGTMLAPSSGGLIVPSSANIV